jgi:LmbE family N-acetylglucosaminyl deacetylase
MVIGAHPDDADYKAAGLAALYRRLGHEVLFVSVTDGSAGHHRVAGLPLAARRRTEAAAAAATLGLAYEVWDHPDGRLEVSLGAREQMIRAIRRFRPDVVLTHRLNDYHPDHRATSQLVQDAAYLLTVPAICADVPYLQRDPIIAYLSDDFTRPCKFTPDVIVDISSVWDAKIAMLDAHASQFYEWLPFNGQYEGEVPATPEARRAWLSGRMRDLSRRLAAEYRQEIHAVYGPERAEGLDRVEMFEACEYGSVLDDAARQRLFPLVPGA